MQKFFARMKPVGQRPPGRPIREIAWSWLGAFSGIFFIGWLGEKLHLDQSALFLIGSFGASAVLVYGAPQAELAQPRNLIGGHLVSALTGVSMALFFGDSSLLAASFAVSLAIVVMHLTRTLHPPGGATALIAVIGGEKVHVLGYWYVLNPVLVGALIMLLVALLVNNLSADPKRHYPVYWL